jgi:hypothetical protein
MPSAEITSYKPSYRELANYATSKDAGQNTAFAHKTRA